MVKKRYSEGDVQELLKELDILPFAIEDRWKHVLHQRYVNQNRSTLNELADEMKLTRERVRQIEQKAMRRLAQLFLWRTGKPYKMSRDVPEEPEEPDEEEG